jgi:glycosyltransferase involved in cell wall biosynthesis
MRITVIVPVRNGESLITRCLQSLSDQTRRPDAIVVADNDSTDKTVSRVQALAGRLPFALRLISEKKPGPSAARNAALRTLGPDTDIVAFLDADCVPKSDWLEQIEAFFGMHARAAGLGGVTWGYQPATPMQKFIALQRHHYTLKAASGWVTSPYDVFKGTLVDTNNAAFRRDALVSVGAFDEALRVLEDADLSLRILEHGGFLFVFHHPMIVYHDDPATVLGYFRKFLFYRREEQKVFKKHFGHSWVIKIPRFPIRIIPGMKTGGMLNGESAILLAGLVGLGFLPFWVAGAALIHGLFWMIRFWPYTRHPELQVPTFWLPFFWVLFVTARILGRAARWWGGLLYQYWVI